MNSDQRLGAYEDLFMTFRGLMHWTATLVRGKMNLTRWDWRVAIPGKNRLPGTK